MEKVMSQATLQKRKRLLVYPLLLIPFLTAAFWALGGGKENGNAKMQNGEKGLNTRLPDAALKGEDGGDKLSFYDKAAKDSAKLQEWIRSDPYYQKEPGLAFPGATDSTAVDGRLSPKTNSLLTSPSSGRTPAPEEELMQKLSTLQRQLADPPKEKRPAVKKDDKESRQDDAFSGEVDRLEGMMRQLERGGDDDPEMQTIDAVMDKILDIQHPERVKERLKEASSLQQEKVYPVTTSPFRSSVSLLGSEDERKPAGNRFYGTTKTAETEESFSVQAVVHQSQSLVEGAVIKLRLESDVFVAGSLVPKGTFVFGVARLTGERLEVDIQTIRSGSSLFPVHLRVYDLDGLAGIFIPGAITREVAKGSLDNAAQLLEVTSFDPSLKAQAANAGVGAAKTWLSKKAKLVRVTVKAGYQVLLQDQ